MALKNLLLHIDDTKGCAKRIEAALALAAEHDAHIAALYCISDIQLPGWADMPQQLTQEQRERAEQHAQGKLESFAKRAKRWGVQYETRLAHARSGAMQDVLSLHARYSDMMILGQVDPGDPPSGGHDLVEQVVLSCGRPVLVIPYIGAPEVGGSPSFGRNVMIGWDAGREATRAVNDALPLLEKAESVEVIAVNPKRAGHHGEEPGADIGLHLSRHGLKVKAQHIDAHDIEAAATLLSRASDKGSDLLVIGAYGHSRLRDLILGGVTESMLEHMTVPVLMSH